MKKLASWMPKRLKIWHKLALVCLAFGLPIAVLVFALVKQQNKEIEFARKELAGTEYLRPLRNLLAHTLAHHIAVQRHIQKDEAGARRDLAALPGSIEEDLRQLENVDRKLGTKLSQEDRQSADLVRAIKDGWEQCKTWRKKKPAEVAKDHEAVVASLRNLISLVGDTSNLILDPDLDSYYMMDAVLLRLPEIQELQGRLAVAAVDTTGQEGRKLTSAEKSDLVVKRAVLDSTMSGLKSKTAGMGAAFRNDSTPNKSLEGILRGPLGSLESTVDSTSSLIEEQLLKPDTARLTSQQAEQVVDGLQASFALWDKSVEQLDGLLTARIGRFVEARWITLAGVGVSLAVAMGLVLVIVRGIMRQLTAITALFDEVKAGTYTARASVATQDELGDTAAALNVMLDNTLVLIQSKDEKEEIQRSITKLLEEVSGVADGDLSKEAEVTADMTGAIADSFNYMLEQLRKIISNVKKATRQVSESANEVVETAEELAGRSETQTSQIINTSAAVEEMATSIHQVSENAVLSATVAQQALTNARQGNETVKKTIQGMGRIRDQVQETAKRIKRLGESSQEIGSIIQIIDDIADRTSILALNASIQAAMAGEAGRGFAVVAEEVERLADRSTEATKKIASLVKTIQSETHEAVSAMEKGIQEVVEGSRMANTAGQALSEIETISGKLADLIQSISLAAKQQARASEGVAQSMNQISETTQNTAAGTKQAAQTVNRLAELADGLRDSVSTFRLPSAYDDGASLMDGVHHNGNGHAGANGSAREKVGAR